MAKQRTTESLSTKTIFVAAAPDAKDVFLAGSFNGWYPTTTPMRSTNAGEWSVELDLPPGSYEFKFVVDGNWCCEPGLEDHTPCDGCVPNPFGTLNRTVEVSETARTQNATAS